LVQIFGCDLFWIYCQHSQEQLSRQNYNLVR
jgi:hypothetical protein